MSSRTSSRSTLTMVPSTMSPSLKYLMVLSRAARKSSAEPMSLRATCGEVTEGLGMWWVAPDRLGRRDMRDSCYWCEPASSADGYLLRLLDCAHAGQTRSPQLPNHDQRRMRPTPSSRMHSGSFVGHDHARQGNFGEGMAARAG